MAGNLRNMVRDAYYRIIKASGLYSRSLSRLKRNGQATILNFHRVSPESSPYWPPLPPEDFDDVLRFVTEHFELRSLGDLGEPASGEKPLAVVSFDDGYADFLEYACPILKTHGVRANLNVIGECAEAGKSLWNIELYDFLASASFELLRQISVPGSGIVLDGESPEDKVRFGVSLSRFFKTRSMEERIRMMAPLLDLMSRCEFRRTKMMNTADIQQAASDHDIGAHSYSHASMEYESDNFFVEDFEQCQRYFETELHLPLETYAFPNGSYRDSQIDFLKSCGLRNVLLVGEQPCRPEDAAKTRITIYGASPAQAILRVFGF